MNEIQFDAEMSRLTDAFNTRQFYNVERTKLIWRIVQHLNEKDFRYLINHLIENLSHPPTPNQIRTAMHERKIGKESAGEIKEPDSYKLFDACALCGNFGYLTVITDSQKVMARCSCDWGRNVSYSELPVWKTVMRDNWEIKPMDLAWFVPKNLDDLRNPKMSDKIKKFRGMIHRSLTAWSDCARPAQKVDL